MPSEYKSLFTILTTALLLIVAFSLVFRADAGRTPEVNLLTTRRVDDRVYLAYENDSTLHRYDLASQLWLSAIEFDDELTAFDVDEEGIYAAFGRKITRFDLNGNSEQDLASTSTDINYLYAFDRFIVYGRYYGIDNDALIVSIDKIDGTQLAYVDHWELDLVSGTAGRQLNRLYGVRYEYESRIIQIPFGADGSMSSLYRSQDYIVGKGLFISDDEGLLINEQGYVASATDGAVFTTLDVPESGVDDVAFHGRLPIVLSDRTLISFSKAYQETGRHVINQAPVDIEVYGNKLFAFHNTGSTIGIAVLPVSSVSSDDPDAPLDATDLAYDPDHILYNDGIVYLHAHALRTIFRWSVAQKEYLSPIDVRFAPTDLTYSKLDNTFYLVHSAQLDSVRADDGSSQFGIVNSPAAIGAIGSAGDFLMMCQNDYESTAIEIVARNLDGDITGTSSYENCNFRNSAWNPALGVFYSVGAYGGMISMEVTPAGEIVPRTGVEARQPINLIDNNTRIIDGFGRISDAETLEQIDFLSNNIADAVWHADTLYTVVSEAEYGMNAIQKWRDNFTVEHDADVIGTPLMIDVTPEGLLIVSQWNGRIHYSVFDESLEILYGSSPNTLHIPTLFKHYCSGPFVDSFTDPSSGWPREYNEVYSADYRDGVYALNFNAASYWTAFTRGDTWEEITHYQIEGTVASGDAVWGLIFGIQPNWGAFYTFEIRPETQEWFILHYSDQDGWSVADSGISTAIRRYSTNTLSLRRDPNEEWRPDYGFLAINAGTVSEGGIRIWIPPGRIGMTGGSFTNNVEIQYDNYLFADTYCGFSASRHSGPSSFVMERAIFR